MKKNIVFVLMIVLSSFFNSFANADITGVTGLYANFAWSPNPESNLAGYKIYYGTETRMYTASVDVGLPATVDGRVPASLSGFIPGITYYFAATAYDTDGFESDYSTEVVWTAAYATSINYNAEEQLTFAWNVVDGEEFATTIGYHFDMARNSYVYDLTGNGLESAYKLGGMWNSTNSVISLDVMTLGDIRIYGDLNTDCGFRRVVWATDLTTRLNGAELIINISSYYKNGGYHHFVGDLRQVLERLEPGNHFISVDSLSFRGTMSLDNIKLQATADTIYDDGTMADNWVITGTIDGASVTSEMVDGVPMTKLQGSGLYTAYTLKTDNFLTWGNVEQKYASFNVAYSETMWAIFDTRTPSRDHCYLIYKTSVTTPSVNGGEVYLPAGIVTDGTVQPMVVDLQSDYDKARQLSGLAREVILEVNGIVMRGSGYIGPVTLHSTLAEKVYEDVEFAKNSGWSVFDNDPIGASVTTVYDAELGRNVIRTIGTGLSNAYRLLYSGNVYWRDPNHKASVMVRADEEFILYWLVRTNVRERYIVISSLNPSVLVNGAEVYVDFTQFTDPDGDWHEYSVNLQAALDAATLASGLPDEVVLEVNGFLHRGSIDLIDIKTIE